MNLKYYLLIFQLEGYRILRFLRWVASHYFKQEDKKDKQPVWTTKAKQLYWLAILLFSAYSIYVLCTQSIVISALTIFVLWLNIYVFLVLALLLLKPYEIVNRLRVKRYIQNKTRVLSLKGLTVIGITGSFGKTSTKVVLGQMLPKTLITPKSYNTLFGIYKVVDYELNNRYRFFVCEMGAYKRGDVKEFCDLVHPKIGILTGINEQHLERFGSIENTIRAKLEILTGTICGGTGIVNLDNQFVRDNIHRVKDYLQNANIKLIGYTVEGHSSTQCKEIFAIKSWCIENGKSVFELPYKDKIYNLTTDLLGKGHLSNVLASITVSLLAGESIEAVIERVSKLKQIPHRLECRANPGLVILDNAYSSNPSGFREALDVLGRFHSGHIPAGSSRILITPGIVELGEKTREIHRELGQLAAKICDEIVLVGNSTQVEAMQEGALAAGFNTNKITKLATRASVQELLRKRPNTIILMENDLPDQYL